MITALNTYEADIGVLGEFPGDGFTAIKLSSAPLTAFTAAGRSRQWPASITLAELLDQPLVLREPGSKTRQKPELAAAARGLKVKAVIEAEGREAVQQIVAAGAGYGVVSAAEFTVSDTLAAIPISDAEIVMDEALICLAERAGGKLIHTFLRFARQGA